MKKKLYIFLFSTILSVNLAYGNIYYVAKNGNDSNPGTEAKPWLTIQKAANTLVAGDTVYIKEGIYNEQVFPMNSGNANSYITYTSYPGDSATIDGNNLQIEWSGVFSIFNAGYIKVSGLKITNSSDAGILIEDSYNIIIENNYTYNTASSGIGVWNSSNIIIDGNEVVLANNDGSQENITVAGTSNFEVRNNYIHNGGPGTNGGEGIDVKDGSHDGKVYKNIVCNLNRLGIYADAWDKHTYNIEIFQNTVYNTQNDGITLASEMGGLLENIKVYNNIVYNNKYVGISITRNGPADIQPIKNVKIINNTVYGNGIGDWGGGIGIGNQDVQNLTIRNNISSNNLSFQIAAEGINTSGFEIDHNLVYPFNSYPGEIHGSIEKDPLFSNPESADFHLQETSPAIDSGSQEDAPLFDFEGNIRPQGAGFDIGAYEFLPGGGEEYKYFIPASAKATGAQGSNWVTDLMVLNSSNSVANVEFIFTPSGQNGTNSSYIHSETIKSNQGKFFSDILSYWYGLNNVSGSIRINSNTPIILTSRTYNDQGLSGTYGQFIPGYVEEEAISLNEKAYLVGIRQDEKFRTNIGFSEIGGKEARVKVTFYGENGSSLSSSEITIQPYSFLQQNVGQISSIQKGFASVEIVSGGKVLSYLSVVDWKTSDAIFIPHQKPSSVQNKKHQLIPIIAKAEGGYGSKWKTSFISYNQATSNQNITLEFYTSSEKYTKNFTLGGNNQRSYEDLISELFTEIEGNVSGSLHINSTSGLVLASRTYNDQASGTYGQFIPAWAEGSFIKPNEVGYISQIVSNSNFRTNMGFAEFEGKNTQVKVEIYSSEGIKLGEKNYNIEGYKNLQINGVFSDLGISGDVSYSYAKVTNLSGGSLFPYASVVDNKTGDAIFILTINGI